MPANAGPAEPFRVSPPEAVDYQRIYARWPWMYYGAADTHVCLATAKLSDVLSAVR